MSKEIIIDGIKIDVRSNKSLYITIGDYIYYIDDSTNEQIMDKWMPDDIKVKNFNRALRNGDKKLMKEIIKNEQ